MKGNKTMKKLTPKEYEAIKNALMSSDIIHQEEPLEEIHDEKEVKVIKSAFAKFEIYL